MSRGFVETKEPRIAIRATEKKSDAIGDFAPKTERESSRTPTSFQAESRRERLRSHVEARSRNREPHTIDAESRDRAFALGVENVSQIRRASRSKAPLAQHDCTPERRSEIRTREDRIDSKRDDRNQHRTIEPERSDSNANRSKGRKRDPARISLRASSCYPEPGAA